MLDEADKLLEGAFLGDVLAILEACPAERQTLVGSATYENGMRAALASLMRDPQEVILCERDVSLIGVKQAYIEVRAEGEDDGQPGAHDRANLRTTGTEARAVVPATRFEALVAVLSSVAFHSCVVFCNAKPKGPALAERLTRAGFPAAHISASLSQQHRTEAMESLRAASVRVLVSTDLVARGVDVEKVGLVVNFDVPADPATYLHR